MAITFNPALTTSPQNSFLLQTGGFVQGAFVDDPSSRMYLAGGVLGAVTQPIWPGMAISESVPQVNANAGGGSVLLATAEANLTGFNVGNQNYNAIITPGNTVQQLSPGQTVMFFRLGSGARIQVQCSSALVTAAEGGLINQQLAWDFTNQQLIPYVSGTALPVKLLELNSNSKVVSYNSGTGVVSWVAGSAAIIQI
jgi:hypothetical protein